MNIIIKEKKIKKDMFLKIFKSWIVSPKEKFFSKKINGNKIKSINKIFVCK